MNMQISWDNSNELEELIKHCYFEDNNNGVLINQSILTLDPQDVNYKILKGLNCQVKVRSTIIDGNIKFNKIEKDNQIELKPISTYCIKENNKYSFY